LREFQFLLQPLGIEVLTQSQLGIDEAEEPHVTFIENAFAKARHVSRMSGLPALADDSGICVGALGGAPGVYSARYAGEPKSDQRNNEKLLREMRGVEDRRAHYYCVLVLLQHADDPQPLIAEGEWHGEIAHEERGDGGFGYDPLFWLPALNRMSAELTRDEKHAISHRGKAMRSLLEKLKV
jgi:XTP/dITP diphosphohydrolase